MKRQLLYAIIVIGTTLLLMEGAARLIESRLLISPERVTDRPGWQADFFTQLFDWHESDPDLLWRFKAGLDNPLIKTNSDHLLGPEISAAKDAQSYRILLLGDSSPVGLGLSSRRQAFGEQFRYLLDKNFGASRRVELINAAVSGYSSAQVLRFLQTKGWGYDPDLIILYCGNNDASISGPFSDHQIMTAQKLVMLRGILSNLSVYRLLRGFLIGLKASAGTGDGRLKVRVSPERFELNLAEITAQCRLHDCPLIILKPPVPCLWPAALQFKPFVHLSDTGGRLLLPDEMIDLLGREIAYCWDESRFKILYGGGDVFTEEVYKSGFADSLSPPEVIKLYQGRLKDDQSNPLYYNNLGVAFWRNQQNDLADQALRKAAELLHLQFDINESPVYKTVLAPVYYNIGINLLALEAPDSTVWYDTGGVAFTYLDSALQADYFSLRIKRVYWEAIDRFSDQSGVTVIDLPELFRTNGGERLFVDHCHPTAEGHRLIAREILRSIAPAKSAGQKSH